MQSTDLLSLDTSNYADLTEWNVLENSMEGLYRADSNNNPAPGIAEKVVTPTNNGKTYTFNLRKNAKWSDGKPVTAQDFANAWRRSAAATAKSGYNYIFSGVKNADKVSAGKLAPSKLGVKAVDSHTLRVDLDHAMPYFNKMMVLPAFFPQNTNDVKKYGKKYGTQAKYMSYDGAFKVTGWNGTNDNWKLEKNHYYYASDKVKLDEINMQVVKDSNTAHNLFTQGKLDDATVTGTVAKGVQGNKNLVHVNRAGTYYARLNLAKGHPLANAKLRKAVNLAVDREKLTKNVLSDGSTPAYTYTAPKLTTDPTTGKDFSKETTPKEKYDSTKAKQLWNEGRKESHTTGNVTLKLLGDDEGVTKEVAQYLQAELQQTLPKLKVETSNVPTKAASQSENTGKFDLSQTLWLADYADPMTFLNILVINNPQNHGKFSNAKYDSLLKQAETTDASSSSKYWSDMRTAEKVLNDQSPVVPLYNMVESHLVNPKLKGVLFHPVGETDYTRAYIK